MTTRIGILAAAVAAMIGTSSVSKADFWDQVSVDIGINVNDRCPDRVWVEPVYETRCERVWVEPVYETRCDRVWREPVVETRCERVWVPDRFELRTEISRDYHGRRCETQVRVLVERAHWEEHQTQVVVREGFWEEVPQRVCVSEGHWAEVQKKVCVRDGYWADAPRTRVEVAYDGRFENRRDDRHNVGYDRRDDDRRDYGRRDESRRDDDRRSDARDYRDARRDADDRIGKAHDDYARSRNEREGNHDRSPRY